MLFKALPISSISDLSLGNSQLSAEILLLRLGLLELLLERSQSALMIIFEVVELSNFLLLLIESYPKIVPLRHVISTEKNLIFLTEKKLNIPMLTKQIIFFCHFVFLVYEFYEFGFLIF